VRACHPEQEAEASLAERIARMEKQIESGIVASPAKTDNIVEKTVEKTPAARPAAPAAKVSAPAAEPPKEYLDAIEKIGAENPSIKSMLPKMVFAGIENGVVTVEFGRDGIMVKRVLESKAAIIEAALTAAFGQEMRLRTRNAGETPAKLSGEAKNTINQAYDIFGRDKIELTD